MRMGLVCTALMIGCVPTPDSTESSTAAVTISPPGPAAIGMTSSLILGAQPSGYWRLGEPGIVVIPPSNADLILHDSSTTPIPGYYGGDNLPFRGVDGALAGDGDTAVTFRGDLSYAHVDSHKTYSLTRTWDYFDQYCNVINCPQSFSGKTWGTNPRGENWVDEVTNQNDFGVQYGVDNTIMDSGVAFVNPHGASGVFQQGLPTTTLLYGEMQIRASWTAEPTSPNGGVLQAVGLIAQQVDVFNHVRAELRENDNHTMDIYIIKVVNGQSTFLATVPVLDRNNNPLTNNLGDWWYLRFRFEGATYCARAWKGTYPGCVNSNTCEISGGDPSCADPSWAAKGTADSAVVGSTAVYTQNSQSNVRPIVYFDDFWVQTTGLSVGMFVKIPNDVVQAATEVMALSKATEFGAYGEPYGTDAFGGPGGKQEYYFRLDTSHNAAGNQCTLDEEPGCGYDLKAYTFNLQGGLGAGDGIHNITPNKWYYVVMELDPGDYNDPNAGLRLFANGVEIRTEKYRDDDNCPQQCQLLASDPTVRKTGCPNSTASCWLITPLSSDGAVELGRGDANQFDGDSLDVAAKYFQGTIDEASIFSRQLGCDEITGIYNTSCQTSDKPIQSGMYATASAPFASAHYPALAVDGSPSTSWTSTTSDPQYFTIDLGSVRDISMVQLQWDSAYATNYEIQISSDDLIWNTVATVPGATSEKCISGVGAIVTNGDGGTDAVCVGASARYIRLHATGAASSSGYSLNEFQVFACDIAPAACVNTFPVAVVGPQQFAFPGELVQLDGSRSFDVETPSMALTYSWNPLVVPTGSSASLTTTGSATTSFVPDVTGTFAATLTVSDDGTRFPESQPIPNSPSAASYPATTVITVIPVADFILLQVSIDGAFAQELPVSAFTTAGNRQAFINLLDQANAAAQAGKFDIAEQKVSSALIRTDGWSLRGAPDANEPGRDWVVDRNAATTLYSSLSLTASALKTF